MIKKEPYKTVAMQQYEKEHPKKEASKDRLKDPINIFQERKDL
jgi:hypothetical protein